MLSIDARLTALSAALQRRQMEQAAPVDELSRSLFDFQQELDALDDMGKAQLLETLNSHGNDESGSLNLTKRDFEYFVAKWQKGIT